MRYQNLLINILQEIVDETRLNSDLISNNGLLSSNSNQDYWKINHRFDDLRLFLKAVQTESSGRESSIFSKLIAIIKTIADETFNKENQIQNLREHNIAKQKLLLNYKELNHIATMLPFPLNQWTTNFINNHQPRVQSDAKQSFRALWNASGYKLCKDLTQKRYPIDPSASADMTISDFIQLFGTDGIFAHFTNDVLKPYINQETSPWTWLQTEQSLLLDQNSLQMFEKADLIRHSFFPNDSKVPQISLDIQPDHVPENISATLMEINDTSIIGSFTQKEAVTVNWPSVSNHNTSKIFLYTDDWKEIHSTTGKWSLFRLLDKATSKIKSDGSLQLNFAISGSTVTYSINQNRLWPAYNRQLLHDFRCKQL